jgi:hypothetical protein
MPAVPTRAPEGFGIIAAVPVPVLSIIPVVDNPEIAVRSESKG